MGSSESTCGYRLIHIADSSPAAKSGLISYLDFIISANGVPLTPDQTLNTIVSKSLNCKVLLKVFNIITEEFRDVQILPSNSWGGQGLLGASVRWEDWKKSEGLRVLEVPESSNAFKLGFQAKKDYILGTENTSINDVSTLGDILHRYLKFDLFVYNSATGKVRCIPIENCNQLGCTVGEGMMNSIKSIEFKEEEKIEEEKVVVTVLQKKAVEVAPPPPPPLAVVKEKTKNIGVVKVLPPPSIYDISMEGLTFQPRVLLSKYIDTN